MMGDEINILICQISTKRPYIFSTNFITIRYPTIHTLMSRLEHGNKTHDIHMLLTGAVKAESFDSSINVTVTPKYEVSSFTPSLTSNFKWLIVEDGKVFRPSKSRSVNGFHQWDPNNFGWLRPSYDGFKMAHKSKVCFRTKLRLYEALKSLDQFTFR